MSNPQKRKPHRAFKLPAYFSNLCLLQSNGAHNISHHHRTSIILINNQHGFRSQHTCETQLIDLVQQDVDLSSNWAETWQLKFNINKCTITRFTRSTSPLTFNYQLDNQVLSTADQHLYLGTRNYHGHHIYLTLQVKPNKL